MDVLLDKVIMNTVNLLLNNRTRGSIAEQKHLEELKLKINDAVKIPMSNGALSSGI